jgi:hypothetical protein
MGHVWGPVFPGVGWWWQNNDGQRSQLKFKCWHVSCTALRRGKMRRVLCQLLRQRATWWLQARACSVPPAADSGTAYAWAWRPMDQNQSPCNTEKWWRSQMQLLKDHTRLQRVSWHRLWREDDKIQGVWSVNETTTKLDRSWTPSCSRPNKALYAKLYTQKKIYGAWNKNSTATVRGTRSWLAYFGPMQSARFHPSGPRKSPLTIFTRTPSIYYKGPYFGSPWHD